MPAWTMHGNRTHTFLPFSTALSPGVSMIVRLGQNLYSIRTTISLDLQRCGVATQVQASRETHVLLDTWLQSTTALLAAPQPSLRCKAGTLQAAGCFKSHAHQNCASRSSRAFSFSM